MRNRPTSLRPRVAPAPRPARSRGSVTVVTAILIVVLLGFAALAIDVGWIRLARAQLQIATDAAAHAALTTLRGDGSLERARDAAVRVALRNRVTGRPLTLSGNDIVFGRWDFGNRTFTPDDTLPNAVSVTGRRTLASADGAIRLFLGPALGIDSAIAVRSSTAALPARSIVVAQDISSSFVDAIDAAAAADVALLDAIHARSLPGDVMAMTLFTGDATVFSPAAWVQGDYVNLRKQWSGDGRGAYDDAKTGGVTVCNLLDRIPQVKAPWNHAWVPACSAGNDGTNPGAAIKKSTELLAQAAGPSDLKIIVLVTDGEPQCCYPPFGGCPLRDGCAQTRAKYGTDMANAAAAAGASIFTVSLGADAFQHAYNASLVRGIGRAYNTPDKTQLQAILVDIADALPISLVQ